MIDIRQFKDVEELQEAIINHASDTSVPYATLVERVEILEDTVELRNKFMQTQEQIVQLNNNILQLRGIITAYLEDTSDITLNAQKSGG